MNRSIIAAAFLVAFTPMAPAQFNVAVLKVEATVEPATVRRGETATWRVTVELAPGWHTVMLGLEASDGL